MEVSRWEKAVADALEELGWSVSWKGPTTERWAICRAKRLKIVVCPRAEGRPSILHVGGHATPESLTRRAAQLQRVLTNTPREGEP